MNKLFLLKEKALSNHIPIIQDGGLDFLSDLIAKHNCLDILEIGTAVGYSSIHMALLNDKIHIETIEIDPARYEEALKNIALFQLQERIHVHLSDALNCTFEKQFDLIFIDGAKAKYKKYLEHFIHNLKGNGIIVCDNMSFHGLVESEQVIRNRNTRQLVKKIKAFKEEMLQSNEYDTLFYPDIGDGILVLSLKNK